ncbi:hypothetical protein GCM10009821_22060 [Aeromicrobium halocynthiae]|uniref:SGNH hydrolase-type esterase domain-containing protein n=1 Tax=Aeromicrobium halocynthiae TaxID=560557 RepID=A0ABN2W3W1_9ACTN
MARPRLRPAVLAATGLLLLASALTSPAAATTDPAPTPPPFRHYVALGDSYTAGPLVPVQLPGPLGCFRSSANYPAFLAAALRVKTFTDVSCSAARTEHLFTSQTANLPGGLPENVNAPQLLALTPETPCRDRFTVDGVDTKIRDARAIRGNVEEALAAIAERAPMATVVVVNYLRILPETGACADVPFAAGDYAWGNEVHRTLNTSLREAARTHGATYVDMYARSDGRDACAGPLVRWVNGANVSPLALNFHPFRSGMRAIADGTHRELTGRALPPVLPTPQLLKRLPAVVDVDGLLDYVAQGGQVPDQVVDDLPSRDATPSRSELLGPTVNPVLDEVRKALVAAEGLLSGAR